MATPMSVINVEQINKQTNRPVGQFGCLPLVPGEYHVPRVGGRERELSGVGFVQVVSSVFQEVLEGVRRLNRTYK